MSSKSFLNLRKVSSNACHSSEDVAGAKVYVFLEGLLIDAVFFFLIATSFFLELFSVFAGFLFSLIKILHISHAVLTGYNYLWLSTSNNNV